MSRHSSIGTVRLLSKLYDRTGNLYASNTLKLMTMSTAMHVNTSTAVIETHNDNNKTLKTVERMKIYQMDLTAD
mgnify:FL=1